MIFRLVVDALARDRRVVTFDNTGAGGSTGMTPGTITQMAHDDIAFVDALKLREIDLSASPPAATSPRR